MHVKEEIGTATKTLADCKSLCRVKIVNSVGADHDRLATYLAENAQL